MKRLKKKPFLLFELLLSFTLLVLIFFPMLKTHFAIANEEIKTVEKMEFERMGRNIFSFIEEQLYENRFHTFDELKKGIQGEIKKPLHSHFGKKYCARYQVIPIECVTKRSNGERYLVFDIELSIIAKEKVRGTYTSTFLVEEHEKS